MCHSEEFCKLDLFNHLPRDTLEGGKQEKDLTKPSPRVVLAIIHVVLQVHLDLVTEVLYLLWVTHTFGICENKIENKSYSNEKTMSVRDECPRQEFV